MSDRLFDPRATVLRCQAAGCRRAAKRELVMGDGTRTPLCALHAMQWHRDGWVPLRAAPVNPSSSEIPF